MYMESSQRMQAVSVLEVEQFACQPGHEDYWYLDYLLVTTENKQHPFNYVHKLLEKKDLWDTKENIVLHDS